jgi:hypothetical protein
MRTASLIVAACALAAPLALHAQVWKCNEPDGRAHYTNIKKDTEGRSCQLVTKEVSVIPAAANPPVATTAAPTRTASAQIATPASFPRVDRDTQKSRDDSRRRILEDELSTEEKSLQDAKAKLTEQEGVRLADERNYQKVLERLKPYQETVERHERNVAALRKEIGNLK